MLFETKQKWIKTSFSIVLPPLIIAVIVYRLLDKFKDNFYVNSAFYGMKPAVLALIIIALLEIFKVTFAGVQTFINIKAVVSFFLILFLVLKFKKVHPIIFIIIGALIGIIFKI